MADQVREFGPREVLLAARFFGTKADVARALAALPPDEWAKIVESDDRAAAIEIRRNSIRIVT
jgi:hypothetical protein